MLKKTTQSPFYFSGVVDSASKLAILRLLASREGLKATGREIARRIGFSAPSTHDSLKDLLEHNILNREIIGRQHIYSLNEKDRMVQKVVRPMFEAERGYREEIRIFLLDQIQKAGLKKSIISLILYGSIQQQTARKESDVDIAVIVAKSDDVDKALDAFSSMIAEHFKSYFGVHLDLYIKSAGEFRRRFQKNQPPISTLMKSYSVLYGKEPSEV